MPRWKQQWADRIQQSVEGKRAMVERATRRAPPQEFYDPIRYYEANQIQYYTSTDWGSAQTVWPSTIQWYANNASYTDNTAWYTTGTAAQAIYDTTQNMWQQYQQVPYPRRGYDPVPVWTSGYWAESPELLSPEEADRRLAATRAAAHKSAIRRKKAIKKGRRLLMDVLTDEQKREYARTRSFTVNGANGRRFLLRKSGTTHELDESGLAIYSHCIHLPYSYIDEDTLVAVKLLLETDVKSFLRIANTTRLVSTRNGINVSNIPQEMQDRSAALASGLNAVNERFAQLSIAAAQARDAAARLGRAYVEASDIIREIIDPVQATIQNAADYGDYAREFEHQIVAEETGGLELPFPARQNHAARLVGHAQDIAGVPVAA